MNKERNTSHEVSRNFMETKFANTKITATVHELGFKVKYLGVKVHEYQIADFINEVIDHVGAEEAEAMFFKRRSRDRSRTHHMTLFNDMRIQNIGEQFSSVIGSEMELTLTGIGSVTKGDNTAWYITVNSADADAFVSEHNVQSRDWHITLGFTIKDIHGVPKVAF